MSFSVSPSEPGKRGAVNILIVLSLNLPHDPLCSLNGLV